MYAAELIGIELAFAKTKEESTDSNLNKGQSMAREVIIFSDSQATIQAVRNPQRPFGQYKLGLIYEHIRAIAWQNGQLPMNTTIRWITAHVCVDGNEFVDKRSNKCGASLVRGWALRLGAERVNR